MAQVKAGTRARSGMYSAKNETGFLLKNAVDCCSRMKLTMSVISVTKSVAMRNQKGLLKGTSLTLDFSFKSIIAKVRVKIIFATCHI
jgi:hypothetical protein